MSNMFGRSSQQTATIEQAATPPPPPEIKPPPTMPDPFSRAPRTMDDMRRRGTGRAGTILTNPMNRTLASGMEYGASRLSGTS